jgi:indole-3-glycerol phosphate synthase
MNWYDKIIEENKSNNFLERGLCKEPKRSLKELIQKQSHTAPMIHVIGEVRHSSVYSEDSKWKPDVLIQAYGAHLSAISVLTENSVHLGQLSWVSMAKQSTSLPVVVLDFITHPLQLDQIESYGADAVILIASIVTKQVLKQLAEHSKSIGLEVIIEVNNLTELTYSIGCKPDIIGINNRDIANPNIIDYGKPQELKPLVPDGIPIIVESGFLYPHDVLRYQGVADAVLIGSPFILADDIWSSTTAFANPSMSDFYPFLWFKPAAFLNCSKQYNTILQELQKKGYCIAHKTITNMAPCIELSLRLKKLHTHPGEGLFFFHVIAAYYDYIKSVLGEDYARSEIVFLDIKCDLITDLKDMRRFKIQHRILHESVGYKHQYIGKDAIVNLHSFHVPDADFNEYIDDLKCILACTQSNNTINKYMETKEYRKENWFSESSNNEL